MNNKQRVGRRGRKVVREREREAIPSLCAAQDKYLRF